jgi:quinol-cytochrome oxidoreductase complex cytochrome b subunit
MEPMKVHLLIIPYVDQNESSLSLRGMMYLNGFINAIIILMWKRLLGMISSNWPLTIWMGWFCVGIRIS